MCLIIQKPADVESIDSLILTSGLQRNQDGWGIMYAQNNTIEVVKGMAEEDLYTLLENPVHQKQELFVHLRMKTHGHVIEANTHPFQVGKSGAWLMHNGVISTLSPRDNVESDTAAFVAMITPILENNLEEMFSSNFAALVKALVTTDRVLILHPDGRSVRLGGGVWTDYENVKLSNTYAWSYPRLVTTNTFYKYTPVPSPSPAPALPVSTPTPPILPAAPVVSSETSLVTELFTPSTAVGENDLLFHLAEDYSSEDDDYSLEDLESLDYAELLTVIWTNPDIAVNAIYASSVNTTSKDAYSLIDYEEQSVLY